MGWGGGSKYHNRGRFPLFLLEVGTSARNGYRIIFLYFSPICGNMANGMARYSMFLRRVTILYKKQRPE
jgi:hypothetical protein